LGTGLWLELGSRPKIETAPNTHFIHLSVMGKKEKLIIYYYYYFCWGIDMVVVENLFFQGFEK
jgi:hypothetical protein